MQPARREPGLRRWGKRIGWLVIIWVLSVAALAVVAVSLKSIMKLVGMST